MVTLFQLNAFHEFDNGFDYYKCFQLQISFLYLWSYHSLDTLQIILVEVDLDKVVEFSFKIWESGGT